MGKDEHIVRYTAGELAEKRRRGESQSDWERVDALTEAELEASIDVEEEGEIDWDRLDWDGILDTLAPAKKQLTIRIDEDVLEWFRTRGPGYQTRMNQVLRAFVEAQREKEAKDRQAS